MLSSTVKDLLPDRAVLFAALQSSRIVDFVGVTPIDEQANSGSAYVTTIQMAEECDLYILILGGRYGFKTNHGGKSATELEFDAAYRSDPSKILIFKKASVKADRLQSAFIRKVSEYHKGYYVYRYSELSDLEHAALNSFTKWITERAAIGKRLSYFDHFIRLAVQRTPFPNVHPIYAVADDHIELKYKISGRIFSIHLDKQHIYKDFWGSVSILDQHFEKWKNEMT